VIVHANAAGLAQLGDHYAGLRARLHQALVHPHGTDLEVVWLSTGAGNALVFEPLPVARRFVPSARARWNLTARQCEALTHLLAGLTNKEIAQRMRCAENTVEYHVTRLLAVTASETRAQLVARVMTLR
jgi:DNA-binding CsgD family transcriptional regulator